ncbi:MAG TPA: hypothetical protein VMX17_09035 [Candidatus Glassbacteria bacterium]|nr:hypothetical protein [Candidatus Glassbacteria bacterium]
MTETTNATTTEPTTVIAAETTETTKPAKKKTTRKTKKVAKAKAEPTVVEQVSSNLKETEEKMKQNTVPEEDLSGEALYSGKFKPAATKELSSTDAGSIRVMQETWNYEDRQGNQKQSTKIAVRPVYRRRDGNLFFAEPLVNIHADKWEQFKKLMRSIKA